MNSNSRFPYWTTWKHTIGGLQPQLPRTVLPEQIPFPDVPPHHLNRHVPGLLHDAPFRRARNCRTGVACPLSMTFQPTKGFSERLQWFDIQRIFASRILPLADSSWRQPIASVEVRRHDR